MNDVVFLLQMFREDRHRAGRHMEGAERSPQGLQRRDDFRILPIAAALEVTKDHHFNEIEQGHGLFAAQLGQFTIEVTAHRHELHRKPFLLIVASGFEIDAVSRA